MRIEARAALALGDRDRLGLQVVVAQHEVADLVGHAGEQRIALLERHVAARDDVAEQDLEVDLVVRGVDAGGIVDRVGVDASALAAGPADLREFDAAALGDAEIGAFADHARAQLAPVDAQRVAGAVADLGMRLVRRLDVGADAAEPQQVDRRAQCGADQLRRRQRLGLDAEHAPHLRRQLDGFQLALEDAAAGARSAWGRNPPRTSAAA